MPVVCLQWVSLYQLNQQYGLLGHGAGIGTFFVVKATLTNTHTHHLRMGTTASCKVFAVRRFGGEACAPGLS